MSNLNSNSSVAEWVSEFPQTATVFEDLRIDYCCGGGVALVTACEKKKLDANEVTARLQNAVATPQQESVQKWVDADLADLCDHIQQTHHEYLRRELPRLTGLIDKVFNAHGERQPKLAELRTVFAELRSELEPHMNKEEQILFPAIRQLDHAANRPQFPFGTVANPIQMMEHEHDNAGSALARIRDLTGDFQPPDGACNTYRVMLDSLERLEKDMHQHVHKENNILFPKAKTAESRLASA